MGYTAGLVGVGGVGRRHGEAYETTAGIDLVAIADVDEDVLTERGEAWGVPEGRRYAGHRAMFGTETLDVVSVAVPTPRHREVTLDAVRRAAPEVIWCEKPIAGSVSAGREMIDACADAGAELVINHSRRWSEELATLHDLLVGRERLGTLRSVTATWPRELLRNGTHLSDLLLHVLDGDPVEVSGYLTGSEGLTSGSGPDIAIDDTGGGGFVITDAGTFVTLDVTPPRAASSLAIQFLGSDGRMSLNESDGEWRYWELVDGTHVERDLPETDGGWTPSGLFEGAAENVVGLLDGTAENRSPGEAGVAALEPLVGLCVSHYTGSRVSLPLDRPLRDATIRSW